MQHRLNGEAKYNISLPIPFENQSSISYLSVEQN